jgi:hypothetical protein
VPFPMCFSMILMAVLCVALSMFIVPSVREVFLTPAVDALVNAQAYTAAVLGF